MEKNQKKKIASKQKKKTSKNKTSPPLYEMLMEKEKKSRVKTKIKKPAIKKEKKIIVKKQENKEKKSKKGNKNILGEDKTLASIVNFLKKQGLVIKERKLSKKELDTQKEIIEDSIKNFLENKLENVVDIISEKRKQGKDLFIQELQKDLVRSKLKIAVSTFSIKDIKKFIDLEKELEKEVNKI